jgi:hypothetical protein
MSCVYGDKEATAKRSPATPGLRIESRGPALVKLQGGKPSRAARAEHRSMRQPRAPVSPLEVPTIYATFPAKMITTIIQAERLAAGHRQGSI